MFLLWSYAANMGVALAMLAVFRKKHVGVVGVWSCLAAFQVTAALACLDMLETHLQLCCQVHVCKACTSEAVQVQQMHMLVHAFAYTLVSLAWHSRRFAASFPASSSHSCRCKALCYGLAMVRCIGEDLARSQANLSWLETTLTV